MLQVTLCFKIGIKDESNIPNEYAGGTRVWLKQTPNQSNVTKNVKVNGAYHDRITCRGRCEWVRVGPTLPAP